MAEIWVTDAGALGDLAGRRRTLEPGAFFTPEWTRRLLTEVMRLSPGELHLARVGGEELPDHRGGERWPAVVAAGDGDQFDAAPARAVGARDR